MSIEPPPNMESAEENNLEYIPTKDQILAEIFKYCENPTGKSQRELSDAEGIYLLETWGPSKEGKRVLYVFQRRGTFGPNASQMTRIYSVDFEGDDVVGGDDIAEYYPQTKNWVLKK